MEDMTDERREARPWHKMPRHHIVLMLWDVVSSRKELQEKAAKKAAKEKFLEAAAVSDMPKWWLDVSLCS